MPSWSQPSRESAAPAGAREGRLEGRELELMRQRFVEALRRAEIISLLSSAEDEGALGRLLSEELCEAFDAEVGLVVELDEHERGREIGLHGVVGEAADAVLSASELGHAVASSRAVCERGSDLLAVGGRSSMLAGTRTAAGRGIVLGVARLYSEGFSDSERALLETTAVSAGQALERLWARDERTRLIAQLKEALVGTAETLANALEAKDNYTASHASEVAALAVDLGRELGLGEEGLEQLRYGAIFHDIGKIAIPDAILNKPGPLSDPEREAMMRHPEIGAEIIAPIPFLSDEVRAMVRHDHEHFDGSGYPDGLRGDQIPLGARIILVVDSYHAMISDRPYRAAMPKEEALAELARSAGTQFDPRVVGAFVRIAG